MATRNRGRRVRITNQRHERYLETGVLTGRISKFGAFEVEFDKDGFKSLRKGCNFKFIDEEGEVEVIVKEESKAEVGSYILWNSSGTNPQVIHGTFTNAQIEAERLARKYKKEFWVCRLVASCKLAEPPVVWND